MTKRIISLLLSFALLISGCLFSVAAEEPCSIEYFEDGSYIVTQFETTTSRAACSGKKTATYYNALDQKVFAVTLTGYFTYTGTSSVATSASTTVAIYDNNANFVKKTAHVATNTAYGSGTVSVGAAQRTAYVHITCDWNGNLT